MTTKIERFDDVWDAIEDTPAKAANMRARADLMIAIHKTVERWGVTQAVAAKRLGLTQPRMNDLMRGRISKFSLDALMNLAAEAGLAVRVQVRRKAA
jgi:predicted XRE-type DNA-binding protein